MPALGMKIVLAGIAGVVLAVAGLLGASFARWIRRPLSGLEPRAVMETVQVKVGGGVEFHLACRQHDGGGKIPVVFPAGDDPRVALLIDRSDFPDGLARQKPAAVDGPNYFVESHAARFI